MDLPRKLEIKADAAKYDASCANSGAARKDSPGGKGVGSTGGVIRSADHTMEMVIEVARKLRVDHHFRSSIHLKTIP